MEPTNQREVANDGARGPPSYARMAGNAESKMPLQGHNGVALRD